ncbi:3-isopropylmalate dehydratase small subunit [Alkalihalobacillus sp. FSL W8-0930]
MEPLTIHTGQTAALNRVNVDTDQIIPKQFLKRVERTGFGQFLFFDWRFLSDGSDNPEFALNKPEAAGASVLIAGNNFGCGSSREHAPWALNDYGFKVIIAPSFADIFYNNCVKNGMLPIRLSEQEVNELLEKAESGLYSLTVDLEEQTVKGEGFEASFIIDPYWKKMLLNGWDEIGLTLLHEEKIKAFEEAR